MQVRKEIYLRLSEECLRQARMAQRELYNNRNSIKLLAKAQKELKRKASELFRIYQELKKEG